MLKNRLCYLFVLLCTAVFFVCYNGYISMYVFWLSLALPLLSLLISLPGMITLRVTVFTPGEEQPLRPAKAQAAPLHVAAVTRSVLPAGRARVLLRIKNRFTGEERRERLEFSPSRQPQILEHKLSSATCGLITCEISKARAYDLLGLFWLPVRMKEESCQIIVQPNVYVPALGLGPKRSPDGDGDRFSQQRPGSDPTELFGLREYRQGDRLNRIAWKLSQKTGSLLVKEASLPVTDRVLLLADLSGQGLEADGVMDLLATLAHFLSASEAGFTIGFSQGGLFRFMEISQPEETYPAIETVLCCTDRSPLPGRLPLEVPTGISRVAYLCPDPDSALLSSLGEQYPGARLTLMVLRPLDEKTSLPLHARAVRVRAGCIGEDLDGLQL